jgi:dTDP-4-dehydrorhamnose reductase
VLRASWGNVLKSLPRIGILIFIFPNEDEANILDAEALEKVFATHQPTFAINCAAYTAVDKAEEDVAEPLQR